MVRVVNKTLADDSSLEESLIVVELVGPAAAGKTSISRALTQRNKKIVEGAQLKVRRIANIPFFVKNTLLLMPVFLRQHRNGRRLTWEEIKTIVYLNGWHHVLRRQAANGTLTILDQGPVYKLARLHGFGPESFRSQPFDGWWDSMLKQWSYALKMVIWLDAPNVTLLERIHSRKSSHMIKGKSEEEANEFLARYRRSYERVISALTANNGPKLIRFDTAKQSQGQTLDNILAALHVASGQG